MSIAWHKDKSLVIQNCPLKFKNQSLTEPTALSEAYLTSLK